jgi:23S rRNA pseudouridine1911/1915/1917 synthase
VLKQSQRVTRELSENSYLVTHEVGPNQAGIRLDAFLKERYRRRSREQIKKAIESGAITVERTQGPHLTVGKLKPGSQLIPGDVVMVLSERKPEPEVDFNYRILHEDETLFIIDKPANLPVHPAGGYFFNTLLVHLRTEGHRNPLRAGREYFLIHRIDKETSGILVLAKDREVCTHLTRQFAERLTEKRYLAVVHGIPPEEFEVDAPMRKSTTSLVGLKMEVAPKDAADGYPAYTRFKRLEVCGSYSLVECFPKTGRQHQIRVHLDQVGHPIVGDKLYGRPDEDSARIYDRKYLPRELEARLLLPRHALHAAGIRFTHPITGIKVEFSSGLPADLREFLDRAARGEAIATGWGEKQALALRIESEAPPDEAGSVDEETAPGSEAEPSRPIAALPSANPGASSGTPRPSADVIARRLAEQQQDSARCRSTRQPP